jgi:hypothetical protein
MERVKCVDCGAFVKPSSLDRHIITAKHKKALESEAVKFVGDPILPFKCVQGKHLVKF